MSRATTRCVLGLLCCLPLFAVGCASYTDLKVTSEPSNATVILDGQTQGTTPVEVRLAKDGKAHHLIVEKTGYERTLKVYRNNRYPEEPLHIVLLPAK